MQMGCHGIGVSRLIAAVADSLADKDGLNWPRVMAPFEVILVPYLEYMNAAEEIYDMLSAPSSPSTNFTDGPATAVSIDTILDDRTKSFIWKLKDADLIGYPVVVLLGKSWKNEGKVEVRCRRLGMRAEVDLGGVREVVESALERL